MLRTHLKIAWRNLIKNKGYFGINILGLSVALTVSFLMLLWVYDEYSMDKFHENDNRLFMVKRTIPLPEGVLDVYEGISYPMLRTATEELPEVERYIPIRESTEENLRVDNTDYRAEGTFTSASFFTSFTFPVLQGDISQLDKKPEAMAISEGLANRIWGTNWVSQAIGSTIEILDTGTFSVEAVYKDFPAHSSIKGDFYYSFDHFLSANDWMLEWGNNGINGIFLLRDDADPALVSSKLNELFQANITGEQKEGCFLQKFSDTYLYSEFDEQARVSGGRIEYLRIFTVAALFLLIISCINFVNLATAYAIKRAGEIGVRKVVGARKSILIRQFLTETSLITFISFSVAGLMCWLLFPTADTLTGKLLETNLGQPVVWLSVLALFLLTTSLAGTYPAFVIASYNPVEALKGKGREKQDTISLRKGLVVLQFSISVLLIVSALIVRQQIYYISHKDLGIARDHLIAIKQDKALAEKYDVVRAELMASDAIGDVTLAGPTPLSMFMSTQGLNWPGKSTEQGNIEFSLLWTSYNFPEVFEIPVVKGTYFKEGTKDTLNIVVNQKTVEIMGMEDPIGKTVGFWGQPRRIIGVLHDFHNRTLHEPIQPSVFLLDAANAGSMFVKIRGSQDRPAIDHLQKVFASMLPKVPLYFEYVDQEYAANYKSETLTGTITYYFAIISILISCLGLFGLAAFTAKQRTKEIGIRKVLGANVRQIAMILSADFLKLVLLAILIASPVAYLFVGNWLKGFAYKIDVSPLVFILAGFLAVIVSMATTSFQAVKAAMANPVKSLRTE
jgi:ABC-type antimicrobial peptide transport system permease subunit